MICLRISLLSLIFSSMSSQNLIWFCFWSFNKILGTILEHTFQIPRSCSKIVCTDYLFRLSSSDVIVLSTCDHFTLAVLHSSDVFICSHCGRSSHLGIILHFLVAFLKTFVPFKDLRPQHHIFTINLFKNSLTTQLGSSSILPKTSS